MEEIKEVKEGRLKGLRVGDKCYSLQHGELIVSDIDYRESYVIKTIRQNGDVFSYTKDGRVWGNHVNPTLYFSKPEIIEPQRPKRKVTKTVTIWIDRETAGVLQDTSHKIGYNIRCVNCYPDNDMVRLTGTYVIEE